MTLGAALVADTPESPPGLETATARNARALLVMSIAQRVLSIATVSLLARLLPVSDFGAVGSALAIAALLGTVADLGVETAAIKALSESVATGGDTGGQVGAALVLRSLLGVGAFAAGLAILALPPFPGHVRLLGALALAVVVNPFWSVYGAVLQSKLQVNRLRTASLVLAAVSAVLTILVAAAGAGALGVLVAQLVASWALSPLVVLMARSGLAVHFRGARGEMKRLLACAWKIGASRLLGTAYYRLDTVLLTVLTTGSQVALYYASYRLTEALAVFPGVIVMAAFPALSRLAASDRERAIRLAAAIGRTVTALALFLAVSGVLLAGITVAILYGPGYHAAVAPIQILLAGTIFMFINSALYQTAVALGRADLLLRAAVIAVVVNVAANLVLIPPLHAAGAAVATLLTEITMAIAIAGWAHAVFGFSVRTALTRATGVGAIVLGAFLVSRGASTPVDIALAGPASVAAILTAGVLSREMIRSVVKVARFNVARCKEVLSTS